MVSIAALRSLLVAVLVVGALSVAGPSSTFGLYDNDHRGTGNFTATNDFPNNAAGPTADAGGPYEVYEDNSIELNGTGSTASQGSLSYSWRIVSGNGSLSGNTTENPTYQAPADVTSEVTVTINLTVTDNSGSDSDITEITVKDANSGCSATRLTFCSVDVADEGNGAYDATYNVEDPSGGDAFDHVEVTLLRDGNSRDTAISSKLASKLSVAENGNKDGNTYTIRIRLYNASGSAVECKEATDVADGTDPSSITNC